MSFVQHVHTDQTGLRAALGSGVEAEAMRHEELCCSFKHLSVIEEDQFAYQYVCVCVCVWRCHGNTVYSLVF